MPQKVTVTSQEYLIIDGQQRITTISLLLLALKDCCSNGSQIIKKVENYLTYKSNDDEYELKLKPIKSDNSQYKSLLGHNQDQLDQNSNLVKNYLLAKKTFSNWINKKQITPEQILSSLKQLEVVGISVDSNDDDPQLIFESINSTGVPLTNSDLIRNYLLLKAKDPEKLFNNYWIKIENLLRENNSNNELDNFFRQLMIMNFSAKVTNSKVYQYFEEYCESTFENREEALKAVLEYAKIYAAFVNPYQSKYNDEIKKWLFDINYLNQSTSYPFLMEIFHNYENGSINEKILTKVVHLIAIYLIRRTICNLPTNRLRGLFASLYDRVFKIKKNKNFYYEAINKYLFTISTIDVMPSEENTKHALMESQLYQNKNLCNLLLNDIENGNSNEKIDLRNLSIEHIMPQTLSSGWNISQEEHDRYVHTLGNLSLTGYNQTMSNRSFTEKKSILSKYTKIKILNEDVLDKDDWTVKDIQVRGQRLANILIKEYQIDKVEDPEIEFEDVDRINVKDPNAATKRKAAGLIFKGQKSRASSFRDVTIKLEIELDNMNPKIINKQNFDEKINGLPIFLMTDNGQHVKGHYARVRDNIYVQNGGSAWEIMRIIKRLLELYGVDLEDFCILVRAKK